MNVNGITKKLRMRIKKNWCSKMAMTFVTCDVVRWWIWISQSDAGGWQLDANQQFCSGLPRLLVSDE